MSDFTARITPKRIQDQQDVNFTLGAGTDDYAITWDNDNSEFVLSEVAATSTLAGATDFGGTPGAGTDGYAIIWVNGSSEFQLGAFEAANAVSTHAALTTGVHGVSGTVVGTSDSQTLTNKTLTAPVISTISNTGTLTLPTSTDTLVGRDTTDTLTNKTLTTPTIGSFTNATHTHQNAAGGGQLDHGAALTGLTDDDHTQYLLATGSRTGATSSSQEFTSGISVNGAKSGNYGLTINQLADTAGLIVTGYDDQSGSTFAASVNAGGSGFFSTTGNMIFVAGGTQMRFTAGTSGDIRFTNSSVQIGLIMKDSLYVGIGGITAPGAFCHVAASTTAAASIRNPSGTAPTSPVSGDFWYDGTNLKFRDGGTTRTITWT